MRAKRHLLVMGVAGMAALGAVFVTVPASAAPKPIKVVSCELKYACLYYNSNLNGAMFKHRYNVSDYAGWRFEASSRGSAGAGEYVKNHAASVDNWDPDNGIRIYTNSNYQGNWDGFPPFDSHNLDVAKNNNASGKWDH
ncbi:peptidase inhibitor family I36 protein [Streptomyces triculaminicus]|uniref:peptidase inhibitor family I36 protein n=1 Tax=Streptomyces triculaminicus TaxID=2816232 RepID=UPI0037D13370